MTNEQLAQAAYNTDVTRQALEHQMRMLVLERVAPDRLGELTRLVHESDDRGEEFAEAALMRLDDTSKGELLAVARRDVRMALLAAAAVTLSTARLLRLEEAMIEPEQVALFAASPVGWIRKFYTEVPSADSWVWRSEPEDDRHGPEGGVG